MSASAELIKAVKVKVQDLALRYDQLKKERDQLRIANDRLQGEMGQQQIIMTAREAEIAELNRKLQEMKEAEKRGAETDKTAMRNRISELVHEIDRCIVMLNK